MEVPLERLWFIANLAEVLVERDDLSLVRMHAPAGDQPPLHVHARERRGVLRPRGLADALGR